VSGCFIIVVQKGERCIKGIIGIVVYKDDNAMGRTLRLFSFQELGHKNECS